MKHNYKCSLAKETFPAVPDAVKHVTPADLLQMPDVPARQKAWLKLYIALGDEWARRNNPPQFVTNEMCWEKAKRATGHAQPSDYYAFANWWYHEHCT